MNSHQLEGKKILTAEEIATTGEHFTSLHDPYTHIGVSLLSEGFHSLSHKVQTFLERPFVSKSISDSVFGDLTQTTQQKPLMMLYTQKKVLTTP